MIEKYVVLTAFEYAAILNDLDTVRRIWCNGRPSYPEIFADSVKTPSNLSEVGVLSSASGTRPKDAS